MELLCDYLDLPNVQFIVKWWPVIVICAVIVFLVQVACRVAINSWKRRQGRQ